MQIWNLLENLYLFRSAHFSGGSYNCLTHISYMIALLGPPPEELLEREKRWATVKWDRAAYNADGKVCGTPSQLYGGPFFGSKGMCF